MTPPSSLGLGEARHVLSGEPGVDSPLVDLATWALPRAFQEECRTLLAALAADRPAAGCAVAFAAASAGAGVTTLARSLARVAAGLGSQRVLLVSAGLDAGGARPPGFARLADGTASAAEVVQRTSDERLFVLAAGPHPGSLAAERAQRAFADLRALFGCVIVDCPPVRSPEFPDALVRGCDGAVLVLEPYKESAERVGKTLTILRASTRVLGVVFNRSAG